MIFWHENEIIFSFVSTGSLSEDVTLQLDISDNNVHPGADIVLVCRAHNMGESQMMWW